MIRERILKYLDKKHITKYQFYKDTGFSNGFLDKEGTIGADKCEKISYVYKDLNLQWLITGQGKMMNDGKDENNVLNEGHMPYITQRRKLKTEPKEIYFPLYKANTRLREDPMIQVYEDDPEMQVPVSFLPQNAFPGCDHGEIATGNSMYPRIVNGGMALGKVIDKTRLVYNELYGIHVKGGSPPVIKYIHQSETPGCIKFVSERESLKDQDWPLDEITFMFRVLFIVNPA